MAIRSLFANVLNALARNKRVQTQLYLHDHPAGDKEVGGGERRPEEGSHHEGKNNADNKILNRFAIKSFNGIKGVF